MIPSVASVSQQVTDLQRTVSQLHRQQRVTWQVTGGHMSITNVCLCRFFGKVSQRNLLWPNAPEVSTVEHQVRARLWKLLKDISVQTSNKSSFPGRCPNPDHKIVATGDAFNDIKCDDVAVLNKYGRVWRNLLFLYGRFRWKAANHISRFCHLTQPIPSSGCCCPAWCSSSSSSSSSVWV